MKIQSKHLILYFLALSSLQSHGQTNRQQLTAAGKSVDPTVIQASLHLQQISQGEQYNYFYPTVEGHQYWDKPVYTTGSIDFEGVLYQDIPLNYDTYNQLVMTSMVQNGLVVNIILDKSRIDSFEIEGTRFVNTHDSIGVLVPGIYRLCFENMDRELQLYSHVRKITVGNNKPGEQLKKFVSSDDLFLKIADNVYEIENKKDVKKAFLGNPSMARFIQTRKLKFSRKNLEEELISLLKNYYQSAGQTD